MVLKEVIIPDEILDDLQTLNRKYFHFPESSDFSLAISYAIEELCLFYEKENV